MGRGFSEWFATVAGGAAGGGAYGIIAGDRPSRVLGDMLIGVGQVGLDTLKGAAAWQVAGITMGVAFYSGILEYEADSVFDWWKY